MPVRNRRLKISTTIAPENRAFLKSLIKRGSAANFAEAVDSLIEEARRAENRKRLDDATAAFYASLSGDALKQEQELELAVGSAASRVDFDAE
jgi:N-methylhydantoinase B/oxoprolinase/acetone carboxylase alpha subunit